MGVVRLLGSAPYFCMADTRLLTKRTDRELPYDQSSERSPSPGSSQSESVGSPHMALTSSLLMPIRGSFCAMVALPGGTTARGGAFGGGFGFACFESLGASPAFSLGAFVA